MREQGRLVDVISGDNADRTTNILPGMGLEVSREGYGGKRHLRMIIFAC
jgi:hypothetical protein